MVYASIQHTLPASPGIYKYYDASGKLLYIGKAKNIKKRVASYFTKSAHSYKTMEMVRQINRIDFTIVRSEHDALLLENSLIKEFQPKYNIELKDDKTYPYIVIKKEPFPRVFFTRRKINDGSTYLGPFTSVARVRELLSFIKQYIPLRTCSLNLSEKNITSGKFKVCLEYHLGNCKGPCVGKQSVANYDQGIGELKNMLKGNLKGILDQYKKEQQTFIEQLAFEKADQIQQKINALKNYHATSVVVNPRLGNLDVFACSMSQEDAVVSFLAVRNGTVINAHNRTFRLTIDESKEEVLTQAIVQFQLQFGDSATELIVPFDLPFGFDAFTITVPRSGEKKKLLEMAEANANYHAEEIKRKKLLQLEAGKGTIQQLLERTQALLSLPTLPRHIECFDNSNFQGAYPVSAMVCFKDGIPSKKDYRHFNVKTVKGINDFATMKEAVSRRYSRMLSEKIALPDLVIIDGGKGQLSAACEALEELELGGKMTVIGLAKNVEEIFYPGDQESLKLEYQSDVLKFLRRIRDEVHRFGITFHRKKRSKGLTRNELTEINGIGEKTAERLLQHFRSVNNVRKANRSELEELIGTSLTEKLLNYFDR
ncbi:MAG: excinuclease ABC subunit UvrC [Bacteroidota bacterium]